MIGRKIFLIMVVLRTFMVIFALMLISLTPFVDDVKLRSYLTAIALLFLLLMIAPVYLKPHIKAMNRMTQRILRSR